MNQEQLQVSLRAQLRAFDGDAFDRLTRALPLADVVEALMAHPPEAVSSLLQAMRPKLAAEVLALLPSESQDELLQRLPQQVVVAIFERLPSDVRADLYKRLGQTAQSRLLLALGQMVRDDILKLSSYGEDTVGSVTSSDYAAIAPQLTVAEALAALRAGAQDTRQIEVIYILGHEHQLLGTLTLRELVLSPLEANVSELMQHNPVHAEAGWARHRAADMIRHYELLALPVLDDARRMIGIVAIDDAMDIEREDDTGRLASFGGAAPLDRGNLDVVNSSIRRMFSVRVFWLLILTVFGAITSTFVAHQAELLSNAVILAAFIAPIVDMGGNAGSQSATLVIRSMALGQLKLRWQDVWFIIKRELPVAAALGVAVAVLDMVLSHFSKGVGGDILLVVGLSMMLCTLAGGVIGALLPFLAKRLGTDPATLSSPLITSIMDMLGVFIYFGLAYAFLGHLLA
ncbi:magnesium transporter [Chromobacterium sphagni]|uniref:Magnesium transporter MgtE n=1 Tax=Chromobacterium sphagni TaxID=1903179 RepID=A0A1S1WZL2_9NEIS|nr:magnesium transporter [Chromobacterium sphagni]OHX12508.1 magnesium transporter [Chromobacterium sphagni]OHX21407.1 magnesium transporter [Chromobacterium sphagni]